MVLRSPDDDLKELRKVSEEVVHAGTLGCPPAVLALQSPRKSLFNNGITGYSHPT
jgi:hypothetical protein